MPRRMIQHNLLKNSISAYHASIEIHNKPNFQYRYETVVLLMINAWELALKAYIRKYIKNRSIFENKSNHTISIEKALKYVSDDINSNQANKFTHCHRNLEIIIGYRNEMIHYYSSNLDPILLMLISKASINFAEFIKDYFNKDIMIEEGLMILPLGFKLPFRPEEFLSKKGKKMTNTIEGSRFINNIIQVTDDLHKQGIQESIVIGFSIFLGNDKTASNSDLLTAIVAEDSADFTLGKSKKLNITNDSRAQKVYLKDDDIVRRYPFTYKKVVDKCRDEIIGFKQNNKFNKAMDEIKKDPNLCFVRKLNPTSKKSSQIYLYSVEAVKKIGELWFQLI